MNSERVRMRGRSRYHWPVFLAINGALLLFVGASAGRETYQQWKVDQEIEGLQSRIQVLEGKRLMLVDTLQKLQDPDTIDREARLRLDLRKPGERVVVLKGFDHTSTNFSVQEPVESLEISNPRKWFAYFFHHESL